MKRTVEDIIEIGRELTAVKERLERGRFSRYCYRGVVSQIEDIAG